MHGILCQNGVIVYSIQAIKRSNQVPLRGDEKHTIFAYGDQGQEYTVHVTSDREEHNVVWENVIKTIGLYYDPQETVDHYRELHPVAIDAEAETSEAVPEERQAPAAPDAAAYQPPVVEPPSAEKPAKGVKNVSNS